MANQPQTGGLSRHALLMIACCAVPLVLIAAVSVFRLDLGSIGYWGLLLLCPLMHLFMMRGLHNHGEGTSHHIHGETEPVVPLPQPVERTKVSASQERWE